MKKSYQLFRFVFTFILLAFNLILMSCSSSGESTSSVTVQIPRVLKNQSNQLSSLSTNLVPMHVVLNVTGSDISPIVRITDTHQDGCSSSGSSNTSLSVEVPQGSARMFQVLIAYCDPNSTTDYGAPVIYYGDITQDISGSDVNVALSISSIGTFVNETHAYGRILTSADGGPTGLVKMIYTPPGRPSMVVSYDELYNGWFSNIMLSDNIAFTYQMENSTDLLTNVTNSSFTTTSGLTKMSVLGGNYVNKNSTYQIMPQQNYLFGFINKTALALATATTNIPTTGSISNLYTSASGTTAVSWYSGVSYTSSGGSTGTCTDIYGTNLCLSVRLDQITNRSQALGFYGPFSVDANSKTLTVSGSTLSWNYMKNAANDLDGLEVFYLNAGSSLPNSFFSALKNNRDGIDCNLLSSFGFTDSGSVANTATSYTLPVTPGTNFYAYVCPYKKFLGTKIYFAQAAAYPSNNGGSASVAYTKKFTVENSSNVVGGYIPPYTCTTLIMGVTDLGSGSFSPESTAFTAILNHSDSTHYQIYDGTDTSCYTPLSSVTLNYAASIGSATFNIKSTVSYVGYDTLSITGSGGNLPSDIMPAFDLTVASTTNSISSVPTGIFTYSLSSSNTLSYNKCYPFSFHLSSNPSTDIPAYLSASNYSITPIVSSSPAIGYSLYLDASCSTAMGSSVSLSGSSVNQQSKTFYVKFTGSGTSTVSVYANGFSGTGASVTVQ